MKQALKYLLVSLTLLATLFIAATVAWICITTYSFADFFVVLSLILKNAGSYSALLVGLVVTIFFQKYQKQKELIETKNERIKQLGHYTLAFSNIRIKNNNDKFVSIIFDDTDFEIDHNAQMLSAYFYVSKEQPSTLKNIMAFSDDYFERNKEEIQNNYFSFCEKIEYISPQFCTAVPAKSTNTSNNENILFRDFYIVLNNPKKQCKKGTTFWISAITEDGFLMFIRIKAKLHCIDNKRQVHAELYQQTTYYKDGDELKVVCRY